MDFLLFRFRCSYTIFVCLFVVDSVKRDQLFVKLHLRPILLKLFVYKKIYICIYFILFCFVLFCFVLFYFIIIYLFIYLLFYHFIIYYFIYIID